MLRFAGPALLEPIARALAHARTDAPEQAPDLAVDLWDSESTGTEMPAAPWAPDDVREHGAIRGLFDEKVQATLRWDALSVLEPARRRALYWRHSAPESQWFERAAPLRALLHLWLQSRGRQLVHAAALGSPDGCVLLAGPAGAGKSSTALACLSSRAGHLADDFCVLEPPESIHALYSSAKLHDESMGRLGLKTESPGVVRNPGGKVVVYLAELAPEKLVASAPVRALAVPVITGRPDTRVVPASAGAALRALAPSTILQVPGNGEGTLRGLARLVSSVPCFRLEVGTDPARVPAAVIELAAP